MPGIEHNPISVPAFEDALPTFLHPILTIFTQPPLPRWYPIHFVRGQILTNHRLVVLWPIRTGIPERRSISSAFLQYLSCQTNKI